MSVPALAFLTWKGFWSFWPSVLAILAVLWALQPQSGHWSAQLHYSGPKHQMMPEITSQLATYLVSENPTSKLTPLVASGHLPQLAPVQPRSVPRPTQHGLREGGTGDHFVDAPRPRFALSSSSTTSTSNLQSQGRLFGCQESLQSVRGGAEGASFAWGARAA